MVENVAFPSHGRVFVHEAFVKEPCSVTKNLLIQTRKFCSGGRSCKVSQHLWWNVSMSNSYRARNLKSGSLHQKYAVNCCMRALINPIDAGAFDWVSVVNQALLMSSVFLAYMAGVIPVEKPNLNSQKLSSIDMTPNDNSFSGSAVTNGSEVDLNSSWDVVKGKLMDSLYAVERGGTLNSILNELEQQHTKRPLSLCAIGIIPRLRLLQTCFLQLKLEVDNISVSTSMLRNNDWLAVCTELIKKVSQPLCIVWLEEELYLSNRKPEKAFLLSLAEKLNGYDAILLNVRKLGKEDLFAELIYILRFGSSRKDGCYHHSIFSLHGVALLEDIIVTLADGIASMYLELISVDSSFSMEMNNLGLSLCTLSTRSLQKLRNEVALNQWLYQNLEAVVSMYEDRFDLTTLKSQFIDLRKDDSQKSSWWKRFRLQRSKNMCSPLHVIVVSCTSIPVKRTKELKSLIGWRYYFSLILELADIGMPFVKTFIGKVSDVISFFLVCLIGRSLGLIYTGIRQCLRWK